MNHSNRGDVIQNPANFVVNLLWKALSGWWCSRVGSVHLCSHTKVSACKIVLGHNLEEYVGVCLAIGMVPAHWLQWEWMKPEVWNPTSDPRGKYTVLIPDASCGAPETSHKTTQKGVMDGFNPGRTIHSWGGAWGELDQILFFLSEYIWTYLQAVAEVRRSLRVEEGLPSVHQERRNEECAQTLTQRSLNWGL